MAEAFLQEFSEADSIIGVQNGADLTVPVPNEKMKIAN
jgi:hypothetical protein